MQVRRNASVATVSIPRETVVWDNCHTYIDCAPFRNSPPLNVQLTLLTMRHAQLSAWLLLASFRPVASAITKAAKTVSPAVLNATIDLLDANRTIYVYRSLVAKLRTQGRHFALSGCC